MHHVRRRWPTADVIADNGVCVHDVSDAVQVVVALVFVVVTQQADDREREARDDGRCKNRDDDDQCLVRVAPLRLGQLRLREANA